MFEAFVYVVTHPTPAGIAIIGMCIILLVLIVWCAWLDGKITQHESAIIHLRKLVCVDYLGKSLPSKPRRPKAKRSKK